MHGASRFQSSRLRGYGEGLPTTTDPTILAQLTQMSAQAAAPATKKGLSLTSEQGSEIISGIGGVLDTFITTIGGIETARVTGKAPTSTSARAPGRVVARGGGGVSGGSGISGTTLVVGGLVVAGLGVGAYFLFRRK